jgi:hypothetical protein
MRLCEKGSLLTLLISDAMLLQNLLHCRGLVFKPTGCNDLFIDILWISLYVAKQDTFIVLSIG